MGGVKRNCTKTPKQLITMENQLKNFTELLNEIKKLQEECNKGNIDVYAFYEEIIASAEYYRTILKAEMNDKLNN
jgi:hypothetical protein